MENDEKSSYGYCPKCGAPGIQRERRIDGNDTCENNHVYPSAKALKNAPEIYYLAIALEQSVNIRDKETNKQANISLIFRDGMVGVMPVFIDAEKAQAYAERFNCNIVKITTRQKISDE